uniref:G_PROTEIN_RECEP_F1_2 domain-containing protein n=1 Tax=Panagrellus redivivus TaxID=6233 RepID=A0A7E4ZVU0_PANRE
MNFTNIDDIPPCTCDGTPDGVRLPNLIMIITVLPFMASCGFVLNVISFIVFLRQCRIMTHTPCVYLAVLALSDCGVCLCGIFVIAADSARAYVPGLNQVWVPMIPYLAPVAVNFQMLSVYITVFAAFDCFFYVARVSFCHQWCSPRFARRLLLGIACAVFAYNFVTFFELRHSRCYDAALKAPKYEICPSTFRSELYVTYYKGYMYTATMAVIPCLLLISLSAGIIYYTNRPRWTDAIEANADNNNRFFNRLVCLPGYDEPPQFEINRGTEDGSPVMMLGLVIALFLVCNSVSLVVNILEICAGQSIATFHHILIDIGNVLVVFNAFANFFIYVALSAAYRRDLSEIASYFTLPKSNSSSISHL